MADQDSDMDQQATSGQVGGAAGTGSGERVAQLESELGEARARADENWDKYLRERAEMDNFRKRQDRIAADRIRREKRDLLHKVLEVMDNLDRAMHYEESMDRESLHQGLRMVQWQLNELLKGEGVTPVATVGQPFDPHIHEAIDQVESEAHAEGIVAEEIRKGYMLGDDMLRPARVKVSSGAQA
jgi:molecular chaperone GrpE